MVISFLRVRATEAVQFGCDTIRLPFSLRKPIVLKFFPDIFANSAQTLSATRLKKDASRRFYWPAPARCAGPGSGEDGRPFFPEPKTSDAFLGKNFPNPKNYPLDKPSNSIY
ncbi:MAG: hypothetical protein ACLFPR_16635 [Desulfococcaceae bacterium]